MTWRKLFPILLLLLPSLFVVPLANGQQTVGLFLNDSLAYNGYTLFSPNTTTYLIDNCGYIINQWESMHPPGQAAYLLENGDLLRAGRAGNGINGSGSGGIVERFSWEGERLWAFEYTGEEHRQHHDIEPLPNGNVLLLAWEVISGEEAVSAGRDPAKTGAAIWSEHIIEVRPEGEMGGSIVWEWHLWDHLVQEFDPLQENFGVVKEHPELVNTNFTSNNNPNTNANWIHANGISYHPERDEIAISSRNFNEIWIIDHSTTSAEAAGHSGGQAGKGGDLLYRWGNPLAYGRGSSADQRFFGQHNIRWVPQGYPDAGKLMVFNNGLGRPTGSYSSVDLFDPPLLSNGHYQVSATTAFGPETLSWTYYENQFISTILSSAQPLPNGHVLLCYGDDVLFREVTRSGTVVWEYISPASNTGPIAQGQASTGSVFKSERYAPSYSAFDGKELLAGAPIELDPWPIDCTIYKNSVPLSPNPPMLNIRLLNNPVHDFIKLENPHREALDIAITDLHGRLILQHQSSDFLIDLPFSAPISGIYVLTAHAVKEPRFWLKKFFNIK